MAAWMLTAPAKAQSAALAAGIAAYETNNNEEARQHFQAIEAQDPDYGAAQQYLGRLSMRAQAWKEAVKHMERAVDAQPQDADYHYWLGRAYIEQVQRASMLRRMGIAKKLRKSLERAVELDPDHLAARDALANFFFNAPGIVGGGKDKAYAQVDEIAARDAREGLLLRARFLGEEKKAGEAITALEAYLAEHPGDPRIYYELGLIYQQEERYEQALTTFQRSDMEDDSRYGRFNLYQIGRTYVFSGSDPAAGIAAFEAYIERYAGDEGDGLVESAYWRKGMLHEQQNDREAARAAYEQALARNPEHEQAREALEKLKG